MTKAELRAQFLGQRRALPAAEVARRSDAIAVRFFTLFDEYLSQQAITIHTFLPIVRQNEVNTWPIIQRLRRDYQRIRIAVSATDMATNRLLHYLLTPSTPLAENRWGVPEPTGDDLLRINSLEIDLVLIPLLVFDRHGHRVGYGKGYYDRFLATCRPDCLKIGLSLFGPVEQIDDIELTDVRLDGCIIP